MRMAGNIAELRERTDQTESSTKLTKMVIAKLIAQLETRAGHRIATRRKLEPGTTASAQVCQIIFRYYITHISLLEHLLD